mgnify:CR=1 FL=1
MKIFFAIFFTILSYANLFADCTVRGISIFPVNTEIKQNSIFVIDGFAESQKVIQKLGKKYPIYLISGQQKIKLVVENNTNTKFTSVLLNLYRDGKDSNGWHADNEKELGLNPIIASLSFGAERVFQLKHNSIIGLKQNIILEHGSLLLMKGTTQHFWKHQIPKTSKNIGPRINLTFRVIK